MRHTKAQVLDQFRYLWKVECIANPSYKGDKIRKRIAFGDFTDMLCKNGDITLKQYETWSNPFWWKSPKNALIKWDLLAFCLVFLSCFFLR